MKKILALLLVLCMMLAAIPALAEDFSGEWHFLIGTVDAGICTLNADGTASLSVNLGEEMSAEGTWSVEGDTITVVADGSPMDFTFDGTVYTSAVMPMSLSREAGKVTVAQLMEYMSTRPCPKACPRMIWLKRWLPSCPSPWPAMRALRRTTPPPLPNPRRKAPAS